MFWLMIQKRKELKNFKLVLNDENIITNIDELEKYVKALIFQQNIIRKNQKK